MINVTETFLPPLEDYVDKLRGIWTSKWLTNRGVLVQELETELKNTLGINDILVVNNGTIALQIAIKALGLAGEIITTPFSYVATTSSIVWENCTPVFVDIDPVHLTIDPHLIEEKISPRTTGILATHVFGNPCDVEVISRIAEKNGLKVIYDAAHCYGVTYKERSLLSWGHISTLSFHATKLFHTGEGGAIVCNDPELAKRAYYMHNFGHNGPEDFFGIGINGKISELQAALGLCLLPYMDEVFAKRKAAFEAYDELLGRADLSRPEIRPGTVPNYSYYPVLFSSEAALLRVKEKLASKNIFPRRYFYPSLNQLPYVGTSNCPISDDISKRILCLPLSANIGLDVVAQISAILENAL
ncbi:MAG: aminotransferase DegT [Acidobacteria bacterium]|nr:MAG: aminotransferase DegT [Acidobacteriota bacterium]